MNKIPAALLTLALLLAPAAPVHAHNPVGKVRLLTQPNPAVSGQPIKLQVLLADYYGSPVEAQALRVQASSGTADLPVHGFVANPPGTYTATVSFPQAGAWQLNVHMVFDDAIGDTTLSLQVADPAPVKPPAPPVSKPPAPAPAGSTAPAGGSSGAPAKPERPPSPSGEQPAVAPAPATSTPQPGTPPVEKPREAAAPAATPTAPAEVDAAPEAAAGAEAPITFTPNPTPPARPARSWWWLTAPALASGALLLLRRRTR